MKLHLPKMLLTAVLAVAGMSAQGAIEGTAAATSATIAGTDYDAGIITFGTPDDGSAIAPTTSGTYTVFTCNKSDGTKQGNGGRYKINGDSTATLANCGELIVASGTYKADAEGADNSFTGGQLFISNYNYNGITTISNHIKIGQSGYSEGGWQGAIRLSSEQGAAEKRIVFTGGITAIQNSSIIVAGNYNYVEGALNGDPDTTLTLSKTGQLHLSGGGNLATLNAGSVTITMDNTKSDGTTATAATEYTIGTLQGSSSLSIASGINATIGTLSMDASATLNNAGTLTINGGTLRKAVTNSGTLNLGGTINLTYATVTEHAPTEGNAFTTADYSATLATGGTVTVQENTIWQSNGTALGTVSVENGVLNSTGTTTNYYVKDAASFNTSALSGATKLTVDVGADQSVTINTAIGNLTAWDIKSGTLKLGSLITTDKLVTMDEGTSIQGSDATIWAAPDSVFRDTTLKLMQFKRGAAGTVTFYGTNNIASMNNGDNGQAKAKILITSGASLNITQDHFIHQYSAGFWFEQDAVYTRTFTGATLTLTGLTSEQGSMTRTGGGGNYALNTGDIKLDKLAVELSGGNNTMAFFITNSTVNYTGEGTLTLSHANNSYKGITAANGTVAITGAGATLTGTVDIKNAISVSGSGALTLTGTVNVANLTATGEAARTEGNGLGYLTYSKQLVSGTAATVNNVTWNINGAAVQNAEFTDGTLTAQQEGGSTYYINDTTGSLVATQDGTLNAGEYSLNGKLVVGKNGATATEGVTMTLDGTTALTSNDYVEIYHNSTLNLEDTAHVTAANVDNYKGLWLHSGSTISLADDAIVTVGNVDFKGGEITAAGDAQIGSNNHNAGNTTITDSDITLNGTTLAGHKVQGGSVTTNGNSTIQSTLSDTTAVTVNEGSTATFTAAESKAKSLSGEGSVTVAANADLTVTNDAVIGALSGDGALNVGGNLTVGGAVSVGGMTLNGGTVTLGTAESHDNTLALRDLNVTSAGSVINANLAVSGGTMTMSSSVEMGCGVTLGADGKEALTLTNATVNGEGQLENYILFTGVDSLTLGTNPITEMGWYDASTVFSTLSINGGDAVTIAADQYVIGYWNGTVSIADKAVPEPATATLSLLALAALAARRKRK